MKNLIKKHFVIKNILEELGVESQEYSLGECIDYKVCVIDSMGGYLVFDGGFCGNRLNETFIMTPEEVAIEIENRVINHTKKETSLNLVPMGMRNVSRL